MAALAQTSVHPGSPAARWQILILENVRFHPEETKNDPEFAKKVCHAVPICKPELQLALTRLLSGAVGGQRRHLRQRRLRHSPPRTRVH